MKQYLASTSLALFASPVVSNVSMTQDVSRIVTIGYTLAGLDAKARGFDATVGDTTVDKWYWTQDESNVYPVSFKPSGLMLVIR